MISYHKQTGGIMKYRLFVALKVVNDRLFISHLSSERFRRVRSQPFAL